MSKLNSDFNYVIADQVYTNIPFLTQPTDIIGNGVFSFVSSDQSLAIIDSSGYITLLQDNGYVTITITISETNEYLELTKTADFLIVKNSVLLQSVTNLKNIGIINAVCLNILSISINQDSYISYLLIDFTWGNFYDENNKYIARHEMLNIIFENNNIISFLATKEFLGLTDGTSQIKIYNPPNNPLPQDKLIIYSNILQEYSVYINLYNIGDSVTYNNGNNFTIIKDISGYIFFNNIDPSGINYNDGDIIEDIIDTKIYFGGVYFYQPILPCLTYDTLILTPKGYIPINQLKNGDLVVTDDNREVPISNIFKTIVKGTKSTYPYIIPKNSITENYPLEDIKLSGGHLIKYRDKWIIPSTNKIFKQDTSKKIINYYHIKLLNYETDNLIINNGTIVESFGDNTIKNNIIYNKRLKNTIKIKLSDIIKNYKSYFNNEVKDKFNIY